MFLFYILYLFYLVLLVSFLFKTAHTSFPQFIHNLFSCITSFILFTTKTFVLYSILLYSPDTVDYDYDYDCNLDVHYKFDLDYLYDYLFNLLFFDQSSNLITIYINNLYYYLIHIFDKCKQTINININTFFFNKNNNLTICCSICLESSTNKTSIIRIQEYIYYFFTCKCNVYCHIHCLENWFYVNKRNNNIIYNQYKEIIHSCPICRKQVYSTDYLFYLQPFYSYLSNSIIFIMSFIYFYTFCCICYHFYIFFFFIYTFNKSFVL